jgi:hypothetical protein
MTDEEFLKCINMLSMETVGNAFVVKPLDILNFWKITDVQMCELAKLATMHYFLLQQELMHSIHSRNTVSCLPSTNIAFWVNVAHVGSFCIGTCTLSQFEWIDLKLNNYQTVNLILFLTWEVSRVDSSDFTRVTWFSNSVQYQSFMGYHWARD